MWKDYCGLNWVKVSDLSNQLDNKTNYPVRSEQILPPFQYTVPCVSSLMSNRA